MSESKLRINLPDCDWEKDIPNAVKYKIVKGLQQETEGKVISHIRILEKHRKQFPHLNL